MDFSQIVNAIYDQSCSNSSDINEHVPTLMKYAKECSSVVEMGVRGGVSTIGFIKGLCENNREEKQYTGVDLYKYPQVEAIQNLSEQLNIPVLKVEKALKSLLLKKSILNKTHNITNMARILKLPSNLILKVSELEPVHQESVYPDVSIKIPVENYDEEDAINFFNIAKEVL